MFGNELAVKAKILFIAQITVQLRHLYRIQVLDL
jgi:hypothetical protein